MSTEHVERADREHSPAAVEVPFGEMLRRWRATAGLTQEELADRSGVSARSISDFERGRPQVPQAGTVRLLADALGLAPGERAAFVSASRRLRVAGLVPPEPNPSAPRGISAPARLPLPPTPLLGREAALADVAACLRSGDVRLLTLTGPAGVGKTRLALEVAGTLRPAFADGCRFVPLAPVRDWRLVLPTIAEELGLPERHDQSVAEALAAYLADRELLLVLDNCEQVLAAAAEVAGLAAACPRLCLLATSRAPLRVRGEWEWPVPPLALPSPDAARDPAAIGRSPAVALFVERARAVRPAFALDEANVGAVAEVCSRLDGLPLALELAAPLIRLFPPATLARRLAHPLPALTTGSRDLPDRQRSLRTAIAWSHELLAPEQRRVFRRLAAFAGGFTDEAAEVVTAEGDLVASLLALAEHSLVRPDTETGAEPRYRMLETIREYALEHLAASGEEPTIRGRHAAYFLALAARAGAELRGPEQGTWLRWFDREHDNLRAALAWALRADDRELALRLAGAIGPFWRKRGHVAEGQRWLAEVLAREGGPDALRASVLNEAGTIARHRRDLERAGAWHAAARALAEQIGDAREAVMALQGLGSVALVRGEIATAEGYYREALDRAGREELAWEAASALFNLGNAIGYRDDVAEGIAYTEAALATFRDLGEWQGMARAALRLSGFALRRGEVAAARARAEEALAVLRDLGDRVGTAETLARLAEIAHAEGEDARALDYCRESLVTGREFGFAPIVVAVLSVAAAVARRRGRLRRGARLLGAAEAWRERFGGPRDRSVEALREREQAALRAALGDDAFAVEWANGRAMPPEEAMAFEVARDEPVGS